MKPKFALDLSHEGINLLHRSKGGWSLVGSVELDDPEMGSHLADLRRRAAALESGGFTCKIIIPNSQVLYTTVEAPGPDDISREVQIRSGLDGLTPYPVGELVFDWRAAGARARVAVLARETMDEAETFAVEHRFNPVSFVARSPQGEFSGEPFFGRTRAATKILGPNERVEPDASPVPRKPPAMETRPASGPTGAPATGYPPQPGAQAAPHSPGDLTPADLTPGDLTWQPPAEPVTAPEDRPAPASAASAGPVRKPLDAPLPDVDPVDDPFAELDAIQAELSGDPDAMPAFRSRTSRPQNRPARADREADQPVPPPLAPFPPTSDEADAMPSPPQPARKTRAAGKTSAPETARDTQAEAAQRPTSSRGADPRATPTTGPDRASPPAGGGTGAKTTRPAAPDTGSSAAHAAKDDTPAQPGVAFSTRRGGTVTTTTATPTARSTQDAPTQAAPAQPTGPGAGREAPSGDRRRADMADALSRPMPGAPAGNDTPKAPDKPGGRGSLSDAVRGAAGGLRSFGQRRTPGKGKANPSDTSMAALMRGAGSSEARISPDQYDDEPDLLAPDVPAKGPARDDAPTAAPPAAGPTATKPPATDATTATPERGPAAPPDTARTAPPAPPLPSDDQPPKPVAKPAAKAVSKAKPDKPRVPKLASKPDKPKAAVSEADALTVFGARRTEEKRGGRKYLGLVLTLLLLLAMGVIAMWSSFFVDDGGPALFNPGEDAAAPEVPDAAPETAPTDGTTVAPVPDAGAVPEETPPEDPDPAAAAPVEPDTAPTPEVLSQEEAEARYAETQIWQRAPEALGEPFSPGLEMGEVGGPGTARGAIADPAAIAEPDVSAALGGPLDRAAPLPPPPADTVFELDDTGLVLPSPEGTVSPTGIIVFEGPPAVVPPVRPGTPALPEAAPEDATLDDAALEQAVEQAVEAAAALETDVAPADAATDVPDLRPEPRPEDGLEDGVAPDAALPDATTPEPTDPDADARLDDGPIEAPVDAPADPATETAGADTQTAVPADADIETAAADPASIEAAVDAVSASFVDATELAVVTSLKPTRRPADIDQIVNAAMARAAAAPAEPAAPATTTPAIPTSASVANQATTPNALNLREINLLGISGPSNARRALVRMENGRYITVKVGDRLDGGRVTSISSDGLTYQKGSRNFTLQLLPLG